MARIVMIDIEASEFEAAGVFARQFYDPPPVPVPAALVPQSRDMHPSDCQCGMCASPKLLANGNVQKRHARVKTGESRTPAQASFVDDKTLSTKERILAALRNKPRSSAELIEDLKMAPGQVYSTASILKTDGAIESRSDDDNDGTRRWFSVG